jgi:hypothetical protein
MRAKENGMNKQQYGGTLKRMPHMTDEHWDHDKKQFFRDLADTISEATAAGCVTPFEIERYETPTMVRVVLIVRQSDPLPDELVSLMTEQEKPCSLGNLIPDLM